MDENQVEIRMNARQKVLVILLDIIVLVELCVGMNIAVQTPDNFTPAFIKAFFGMLLPTLAIGFVANRLLRSPRDQVQS